MTPYDILGLTEGESDERAIKRAYARLLKQHRPDQDPEGFRRLHDAYRMALRMADDDGGDDDDDADVRRRVVAPPVVALPNPFAPSLPRPAETAASSASQPSSVTALVPIAPPEFSAVHVRQPVITSWDVALGAVQAAAELPVGALRDGAMARALRRVAELAWEQPGGGAMLMRLLEQHVPERGSWRTIFSDDVLMAELRRGGSDLTANTLKGCFEVSDWERLTGFAHRWLNDGMGMETDQREVLALTRALAIWLALVDYPLAQRLMQQFPAPVLRAADEELDQIMALGFQARILPGGARRFLCDVMRGRNAFDPAMTEERGHLLAHLPRIPPASLLGTVVRQYFPGHLKPPRTDGATQVPVDLLSLTISALAVTALVVSISAMSAISPPDPWPAIITISLLILLIGGGIFAYRRLASWYFSVVRPWMWKRVGPFDVPCLLLVMWLALAVVVPLLIVGEASGVVWLLVGCAYLPASLVLIHWARRGLNALLTDVASWSGTGQRLRSALVGEGVIGGDLTLVGFLRAVRALWAGLPAMAAAGVLIIGLATCPAFNGWHWIIAFNFWVAPWTVAALVIHAVLIDWRQQQGSWWRLLSVLVWCCWLPAAAWLATMLMVWTGHATEPASVAIGIFAVVVAALLPAIIVRRLRRR